MPPGARAEAPANVQDEELFRQPGAESFTGDALEERRAILDAEEIAGRTLKTEEQQIILNRYTGESQATRFVEAETDRLRRESGDDTLELTEEQKQDVYQRYFASEIRNDMEEERRQLGRELTEEEKEDIIYHYFENDAFNQIDEFTNEILERYQDEFKPAPTGRLERFVNFFKKPAVKRAVVTAAASIVIRTLIHLTPLSPIAGTLTGFAIGGWRGYQRGKETTEKEMFSLSGVTAEYQRILRETDAPHARANALSFLQNILETGDFKGNAGDLLKLLVMYRAEAGRVENLDIASLSHMGKLQREEFDESVKKAAKEAGIAGMKKGMLKGALIGAGTDLIAFGWHWLNTEHLKHEYITQHYGAQHEIRTTDGPDLRTDHLTPDTSHNPIFDHMDRYTTEYGDNLSKAVEQGVNNGDLTIPKSYFDAVVGQNIDGHIMTQADAIKQFVHNFSFAQPLPGHEVSADGYWYDFNKEGLQHLINRTTDQSGNFDYSHMADTLKHADEYLTRNFPVRGFDYTLHDQIPFQSGEMYQDAVKYAAEHAGASGWHGGILGVDDAVNTAALAGGMALATKEPGSGKAKSGGAGGAGGNAETPTNGAPGAPGEPPVIPPAVVNPEQTEAAPPAEDIAWDELLQTNRAEFKNKADATLRVTRIKDWADMSDIERNNISDLMAELKTYNDSNRRFQIRLRVDGTDYLAGDPPAAGSPDFNLNTLAGVAATQLQLGTKREAGLLMLKFEENAPRGTIDYNTLTKGELMADLSNLDMVKNTAYRRIELIRLPAQGKGARGDKPIWPQDDLSGVVEIVGVNVAEDKIKVVDSQGVIYDIPKTSLNNVARIEIRNW